jgi:hypothetical protein
MNIRRAREAGASTTGCFLNVPYDKQFERLFLAYIAGLMVLDVAPRVTIEVPGGDRRLNRILQLIRGCRYSLHDLSRVQLAGPAPRTPRFNMPFEAGLAVAVTLSDTRSKKDWFVFESRKYRVEKSLSDLSGTDVYIHDGRVSGVFRQLNNAFHRPGTSVRHMSKVYRDLRNLLPVILRKTGAGSAYERAAFRELVLASWASANRHLAKV